MQEYIPFFQSKKRSIAEKLAKYFEYSGLETRIEFDEENNAYVLLVPSENEKEAIKYYQAFYFVEKDTINKQELDDSIISVASNDELQQEITNDELQQEITNDELQQEIINEEVASEIMNDLDTDTAEATDTDTASIHNTIHQDDNMTSDKVDEGDDALLPPKKSLLSSSGSYIMKSEKYNDYNSTQYVFLLLGTAGIIFVILNVLEVFTFLYGLFPNLIMGALFLFFIYVGISTGKKAKLLKLEIDEETNLTNKINEWLLNTITEEFLESITSAELSKELDYIKKTDTIRDMLVAEFGQQDNDYLDRLIEEFYSETFDKSETYIES